VTISRRLLPEPDQDRAHRVRQVGRRDRGRPRTGANEVSGTALQQLGVLHRRDPQPSPHSVARHGVSDRLSHGVRDAGRFVTRAEHHGPHLEISRCASVTARQRPKRCLTTDAPDQAESLERPLVRRRRITARPARFRIRRRKPCFFLRFRLFGWYVRFTHGLLERPGRGGATGRARDVSWSSRASGALSLRADLKARQSGARAVSEPSADPSTTAHQRIWGPLARCRDWG
jgi:hypothetical protein